MRQLPCDEERPEKEGIWEDLLRWMPTAWQNMLLP